MKKTLFYFGALFCFAGASDLFAADDYSEYLQTQEFKNPREFPRDLAPYGWQLSKKAILKFQAEMFAFYPDQKQYFLLRDMAFPYFLVRELTNARPDLRGKISLLNISRKSVETSDVTAYLRQEGVFDGPAVLLDTAIVGNIFKAIKRRHRRAASSLKMHMLSSTTKSIPDTELFDETWSPLTKFFGEVGGSIFEEYPHQIGTAVDYDLDNEDRWFAVHESLSKETTDVDSYLNKRLLEDLSKFGKDPINQKMFFDLIDAMTKLTRAARGDRAISDAEIAQSLIVLEANESTGFLPDLSKAIETGNVISSPADQELFWSRIPDGKPKPRKLINQNLGPEDLKAIVNSIVKNNPELAEFVRHPNETIPKLGIRDIEIVRRLSQIALEKIQLALREGLLIQPGWNSYPELFEGPLLPYGILDSDSSSFSKLLNSPTWAKTKEGFQLIRWLLSGKSSDVEQNYYAKFLLTIKDQWGSYPPLAQLIDFTRLRREDYANDSIVQAMHRYTALELQRRESHPLKECPKTVGALFQGIVAPKKY